MGTSKPSEESCGSGVSFVLLLAFTRHRSATLTIAATVVATTQHVAACGVESLSRISWEANHRSEKT